MEALQILSRSEMKHIVAGDRQMCPGDICLWCSLGGYALQSCPITEGPAHTQCQDQYPIYDGDGAAIGNCNTNPL